MGVKRSNSEGPPCQNLSEIHVIPECTLHGSQMDLHSASQKTCFLKEERDELNPEVMLNGMFTLYSARQALAKFIFWDERKS